MYLRVASLLLLIVAANAVAVKNFEAGRGLLARAEASTSASASSSPGGSAAASAVAVLRSEGGDASVFVEATSESITEIANAFAKAVADAIVEVEAGGDAVAEATAEANAMAKAVAEAFTTVEIEIFSDDETAEFCAEGASEADASAKAFATVLVEVLAEASDKINFASVDAAVQIVAGATADAFAASEASVCGDGEAEVAVLQENLARAVAEPYVTVTAAALAQVAPGVAKAELVVDAKDGVVEVTTVESASEIEGEGDFDADAGGVSLAKTDKTCSSRLGRCCRSSGPPADCACASRDCEAELREEDGDFYYVVVFNDRTFGPEVGETCRCA